MIYKAIEYRMYTSFDFRLIFEGKKFLNDEIYVGEHPLVYISFPLVKREVGEKQNLEIRRMNFSVFETTW
jgi:hypothetical protein